MLEVNLSPSLSTDTQLDFDIKSELVKDLLNLVGMKTDEQQQKQTQKSNEI